MNNCKALRFDDRPDYAYLRRLFKDLFMREGFINDGVFDWTQQNSSTGLSDESTQDSDAALALKGAKNSRDRDREGRTRDRDRDRDRGEREKEDGDRGKDGDRGRAGVKRTDTNTRAVADRSRSLNTTMKSMDLKSHHSRTQPKSDAVENGSPREWSPDPHYLAENQNEKPEAVIEERQPDTAPKTPRKQGFFMSMLRCGSKSTTKPD